MIREGLGAEALLRGKLMVFTLSSYSQLLVVGAFGCFVISLGHHNVNCIY